MMNFVRFSTIAAAVMVLSACGGGSDSNSSPNQTTYSPVGVWRDNSSPGYLVIDDRSNFWAAAQPSSSIIVVYNGNYSTNRDSNFNFNGDIEIFQTGYQPVKTQINGSGNVSPNIINIRSTVKNQTTSNSFSWDSSLNSAFTVSPRTYTMFDGPKITFKTPQTFTVVNDSGCLSYGSVTYTVYGFNYYNFKNCASGVVINGVMIKDSQYYVFISRNSAGALNVVSFQ